MAVTVQHADETGFAQGLAKDPDLAREVSAVIQVDITGPEGGKWTLDSTQPSGVVKPGFVGTPAVTLPATATDLLDIGSGRINEPMAMTGKLKIRPMNVVLAMKLGKALAAGKGS